MGAETPARLASFRSIPMFGELSDEAIERIMALATEADVPAGQLIIEGGQPGAGLFVIEEGTVVVEAPRGEIELGPGNFVGELALLTPASIRSARVQARTPVRVLAIARSDFDKLLDEEPTIARSMLRVVAERLAQAMTG